jgi:calcineurin-like phosphoesterase family protein
MSSEKMVKDGVLLLHLSDIHFREPYCLNLNTDQEHPVRTALLSDIRNMVKTLGPIDAVLVSGDIAYKGHPDEYKVAAKWLLDITGVAGCKRNAVYTVPGNHDVNRNNAGNRITKGIRTIITGHKEIHKRDKELYDTLHDDKSGLELIQPMEEYNKFSAAYECDTRPQDFFWLGELPLAPGWKLKMHGLTTTLFSGPDDDIKGELFLGALQRSFALDDGIVRLAIMHHPPDWLYDQEELDDAPWNGCALHLMGHKHRQRYHPGAQGIRLSAGAVNPSRGEGNWEPGYNLINLVITRNERHQCLLHVESHLRIWQASPDRFVPKIDATGQNVFIHDIPLHQPPSAIPAKVPEELTGIENKVAETKTAPKEETEMVDISTNKRDIVFNFWNLSASQRRTMMQNLDLLEREDDRLPETLRYRRAFERAQKRGMISEIEKAINNIRA